MMELATGYKSKIRGSFRSLSKWGFRCGSPYIEPHAVLERDATQLVGRALGEVRIHTTGFLELHDTYGRIIQEF